MDYRRVRSRSLDRPGRAIAKPAFDDLDPLGRQMHAPFGDRRIAEQAEIAAARHGIACDSRARRCVLQADLALADLQRIFSRPPLAAPHAQTAPVEIARRGDAPDPKNDTE